MNSSNKINKLIDGVRNSAHIVFLTQQELKKYIKVGVELKDLDKIAKDFIIKNNARPAFLNYHGFPSSICTSVNDVLVHGIATNYLLKEGDVISIDIGVEKDGFYGDAAFTIGVGKITKEHQKLIDITKLCLQKAISILKPGIKTGDIGFIIEKIAKENNFSVPKDYVGHGIGDSLHQDPIIPNYGLPNTGETLKENMIICIEPMLIDGKDDLYVDPIDNWTVRTKHRGYCAHEEHTLLITKDGYEILSL